MTAADRVPDLAIRADSDARMAAALVAGETNEIAAAAGGVSARTLRRRLHDPDFRQLLADARRDVLAQVAGRLTVEAVAAVSTLAAIRDDSEASTAARVGACRAILDRYADAAALAEQSERLDRIEQVIGVRHLTDIGGAA